MPPAKKKKSCENIKPARGAKERPVLQSRIPSCCSPPPPPPPCAPSPCAPSPCAPPSCAPPPCAPPPSLPCAPPPCAPPPPVCPLCSLLESDSNDEELFCTSICCSGTAIKEPKCCTPSKGKKNTCKGLCSKQNDDKRGKGLSPCSPKPKKVNATTDTADSCCKAPLPPCCAKPPSQPLSCMSCSQAERQSMASTCCKPEVKKEASTCCKPEAKPQASTCCKPEAKSEASTCCKPEVKKETSTCCKPEAKPQASTCCKPEAKPEVKRKTSTCFKPVIKSEDPPCCKPASASKAPPCPTETGNTKPCCKEPQLPKKPSNMSEPMSTTGLSRTIACGTFKEYAATPPVIQKDKKKSKSKEKVGSECDVKCKCSCRFPPAFSKYECTGIISGTCKCSCHD